MKSKINRFHIGIDANIKREFKAICEKEGRQMSKTIERLIRQYLNKKKEENNELT